MKKGSLEFEIIGAALLLIMLILSLNFALALPPPPVAPTGDSSSSSSGSSDVGITTENLPRNNTGSENVSLVTGENESVTITLKILAFVVLIGIIIYLIYLLLNKKNTKKSLPKAKIIIK